ncbi:MAG: hypothetical protein F6K47_05260 [Symploca sp. SIO2E6]|nr:hypothetical protein [Symploca sp. SIO2E6]
MQSLFLAGLKIELTRRDNLCLFQALYWQDASSTGIELMALPSRYQKFNFIYKTTLYLSSIMIAKNSNKYNQTLENYFLQSR